MTAPDLSAEERAALDDVVINSPALKALEDLLDGAFRAGLEYERKQTAATPMTEGDVAALRESVLRHDFKQDCASGVMDNPSRFYRDDDGSIPSGRASMAATPRVVATGSSQEDAGGSVAAPAPDVRAATPGNDGERYLSMAQQGMLAPAPGVRAAAIEECAKRVEDTQDEGLGLSMKTTTYCAAAIRALGGKR